MNKFVIEKGLIMAAAASTLIGLSSVRPASSFSTSKLCGGRVHAEITDSTLRPLGFAPPALMRIDSANDAQDQLNAPDSMHPECHAINNQTTATFAFIESRFAKAIDLASDCDRSNSACKETLQALGQTFHAIQDFYAHSNYLELLLSKGERLHTAEPERLPDRLTTCYQCAGLLREPPFATREQVVNELSRQFPKLIFHTNQEFGMRTLFNCSESTVLKYATAPVSLCYLELSKDNARTLEGSVVSEEYRRTYFDLARQLAAQDTLKIWQRFDKQVRRRYGQRADAILLSLKLGKPSQESKPKPTVRTTINL